jgi:4-diphosphocytidyl-2C-methyl-D-erythritol kinase
MTAQSPLPAPSAAVRVRAPAKINLHLAVGDVRADGYHDLVTVFHAVDLADELVITSAERHSVRTAPADGVPIGAKNLAGVAARSSVRGCSRLVKATRAESTPGTGQNTDLLIDPAR